LEQALDKEAQIDRISQNEDVNLWAKSSAAD
jgi:hypothetical protein